MMRSEKRILTTHTGSLPRPEDVLEMMRASEGGRPFDRAALQARIREAVGEAVHRQIETGIDLVNDGEMSKPSYATYVKDRLSGFTGASGRIPGAADLAEFRTFTRRAVGKIGVAELGMPACKGPVRYENARAVAQDINNLAAALGGEKERGFLTAASPALSHSSSPMFITTTTKSRHAGRRDEDRIPGDCPVRLHAAVGLPRPGNVAPHPL